MPTWWQAIICTYGGKLTDAYMRHAASMSYRSLVMPIASGILEISIPKIFFFTLYWRHNDRDGVSNHQPHDCSFNRLFKSRSKQTSKHRVTGFCAGNSPVTGGFPTQMASNGLSLPRMFALDAGSPPDIWYLFIQSLWQMADIDLHSNFNGQGCPENLICQLHGWFTFVKFGFRKPKLL